MNVAHYRQLLGLQSNAGLRNMAEKMTINNDWNDLVLSADQQRQLRAISDYLRYRTPINENRRLGHIQALGKGIKVLFHGPPGTGKTMTAGILAGELGMDMFRIDLSMLVSKYVKEREKNLIRIFDAAESSDIILFFDEAHALFGKRTIVSGSNGGSSKMEIRNLLKKIDEYEGIVIMATDFCKNMDETFMNRIHLTIRFPITRKDSMSKKNYLKTLNVPFSKKPVKRTSKTSTKGVHMNKTQLTSKLAEKTGMTKGKAGDALNGIIEIITEELKGGGKVILTGFGSFSTVQKKARTGRNPQTGKKISIPACQAPKFKAGKLLKDALS